MPGEDYFQEYGPIKRRRARGELESLPDDLFDDREPLGRRAVERWPSSGARSIARRRRRSPLRGLLLLCLALCGVVLGLPYAADFAYAGRVFPGVRVQGVDVQGVSRQALRAALATRYADFLDRPVTLTYGEQSWQPTFEQIGVRFDADSAVADVLAAGRRGGPINRLQELWALWRGGLDVAPRLVADQGTMQRYLLTLAPDLELAPRDAALSVAEGKVIGTPANQGRQLLAEATGKDMLRAIQTLSPQVVQIRTRELAPSLDDTALVAAQQRAQKLLSGPLVLIHGDRSWTWPTDKLAELLRLEQQDRALLIEPDGERLNQAVQRLAQLVDSGSAEPRARFENGALRIVQEGRVGQRLRQPEALAAISATLQLDQPLTRTLVLPVELLQPQVTTETLGTLGIVELVGEGKSSFAGSAEYRITNIKAGATRIDGVLIPPDSEFSFNTQLGEVDEQNGFVQGYAVVGNRTQLEWGGGVCQDSTTVFRAAFWAGLPITERYAHPFYISWYDRFGMGEYGDGAGLDAAIFTGLNDLKFANNTKHWLLMQADIDEVNQVLTVRLFGTKDRSVELQGPEITNEVPAPSTPLYLNDPSLPAGTLKQTDTARGGRDIVVYRVVTVDGVRGEPEPFYTRFKAWPNVFVRGTG